MTHGTALKNHKAAQMFILNNLCNGINIFLTKISMRPYKEQLGHFFLWSQGIKHGIYPIMLGIDVFHKIFLVLCLRK
ncbi:hypothetical protein D3C80_793110 [compost metagenome]